MARQSSRDRLVRLMALPAWVAEHDGAPVEEAAAVFGVSAEEILRDVDTLWVSGLPGGLPGDLVDFSATALEAGRLSLTEPLGLDRPVRLSRPEAASLVIALEALRGPLAGDAESLGALDGALAALRGALAPDSVGEPEGPPRAPTGADGGARVRPEVLRAVRRALGEGLRLHLEYASATDEPSTRDVDPLGLETDGSHLILRAWCLTARGERSFRLDRVLGIEVLDTPARPHRRPRTAPQARPAPVAVLELAAAARWLVEQVPCAEVVERDDGGMRAVVVGRDEAWLRSLILSAGAHVRAVEPPELGRAVAAEAAAALELYGEVPPRGISGGGRTEGVPVEARGSR